jgi:hypothetical protein
MTDKTKTAVEDKEAFSKEADAEYVDRTREHIAELAELNDKAERLRGSGIVRLQDEPDNDLVN